MGSYSTELHLALKFFYKITICAPVHSTYLYATLEGTRRGKKRGCSNGKEEQKTKPIFISLIS